jgi:hypothetical protein
MDQHVYFASIATGGLFLASVFARALHDPPEQYATQIGSDMLEHAIQWRNASDQTKNLMLQLQYAIQSNAYLHAARSASRDAELERQTGTDIRKLKRSTETKINEALQAIHTKCPKLKMKPLNI